MENKQPRKLNAVKHGLLAKEVIIEQHEVRPFNKLMRRLLGELAPQTVLERILAEQLAINFWRLRRFLQLEGDIYLLAGSPKWNLDKGKSFAVLFSEFVKYNPSFDLLTRYNATILRSFYRSLHEYQELVDKRKTLPNKENGQ